MLTYARNQGGVTVGKFRNRLDNRLRLDVVSLAIGFRHLFPPSAHLLEPDTMPGATSRRQRVVQEVL